MSLTEYTSAVSMKLPPASMNLSSRAKAVFLSHRRGLAPVIAKVIVPRHNRLT